MQSFSALFPHYKISKTAKERFVNILHEYSPLKAEVIRLENNDETMIINLGKEEFITVSYITSTLLRFHYNFGTHTMFEIHGAFDFTTMLMFILSIVQLQDVRNT
jgi:hypothetical protein